MKKARQPNAYQIFEDLVMLVGSVARLGKSVAANKIQQTAETASDYVSNVELPDFNKQLSGAKEGLSTLTDYATNTEVRQMIDDVGGFARRHPVTTLVSVVAVGAALSRLFMSDTQSEQTSKRAQHRAKSSRTDRASGRRTTRKSAARSTPKAASGAKTSSRSNRKGNGAAHAHA